MATSKHDAMKEVKRGAFIAQYGMIDVVLTDFPERPKSTMMVLVFGWEGSGFEPDHHSLN